MKHIPNLLTVLRLLCVPLFLVVYFAVAPIASLPISWIAALTDVLDGYLARRSGWITGVGKVLDPIADKLMQGALLLAVVLDGILWWPLAIAFALKELTQGVLGVLMHRRRRVLVVSHWYGKAALTLFYLAVNLAVIVTALLDLSSLAVPLVCQALFVLALLMMLFAFVSYVVSYANVASAIKKEWKGKPSVGD